MPRPTPVPDRRSPASMVRKQGRPQGSDIAAPDAECSKGQSGQQKRRGRGLGDRRERYGERRRPVNPADRADLRAESGLDAADEAWSVAATVRRRPAKGAGGEVIADSGKIEKPTGVDSGYLTRVVTVDDDGLDERQPRTAQFPHGRFIRGENETDRHRCSSGHLDTGETDRMEAARVIAPRFIDPDHVDLRRLRCRVHVIRGDICRIIDDRARKYRRYIWEASA